MFQFGVEVESEVAEFGAKLGGHLEEVLGGGETEIFGGQPSVEAAELGGQGGDGLLPGGKAFAHDFLEGDGAQSAEFDLVQAVPFHKSAGGDLKFGGNAGQGATLGAQLKETVFGFGG